MKDLFHFAADLSRLDALTYAPSCAPTDLHLESVTISADAMPGHHVARAIILDLQPADMVTAIVAVETRIRVAYPYFRRTGWRAAADGLTVYFSAWTCAQAGGRVA
jgi:hypothetical protein